MENRVAMVTGGVGGLGTAICVRLARAGYRVAACDVPCPAGRRLDSFKEAIRGLEGDIQVHPLDVREMQSCETCLTKITSTWGRLDVVVNAAGITRDATLGKLKEEDWDSVLDIDLSGIFRVCKAALPYLKTRSYGRIINISSVNGQTGQFGQVNYSAAKAGVHGLTMALAREVARHGITVNTISPGYCQTEMVAAVPVEVVAKILESVPIHRLGRPEEIAAAVAFLASEDAGFITGANVPINGGYFMSF